MARQKFFQVEIPDPCSVPWESMSFVDDERRHCSSCEKVITDFTTFSDDELVLFFKHNNGKLCGRFRQDQLNKPLPLLSEKTNPSGWWKSVLLLMLGMISKPAKAQENFEKAETHLTYKSKLPDEAESAGEMNREIKPVEKENPAPQKIFQHAQIEKIVTISGAICMPPTVGFIVPSEQSPWDPWINLVFLKKLFEKGEARVLRSSPDEVPATPGTPEIPVQPTAILPSPPANRRRK